MIDIEEWKWDMRQAFLDYGTAIRKGEDEGIREVSERAVKLIDAMGAAMEDEGASCAGLDAMVAEIMKDRPKCDPAIYGEVVAKFLDAKDEREIRRDLTPVAKKLEPMTDAEREDRCDSFFGDALLKHMAPELWAKLNRKGLS